MRRHITSTRSDWQERVESQGLHYHTAEGQPYWDEMAYYEFSSSEIDTLERATYELQDLCLKAVEQVFARDLLSQFGVPPAFHGFLRESWERDELTVYGRLLARCNINGQSLNEQLVRKGYAVARPSETRDYVAAEAAAKEEKLGLWQGKFLMPAEFRRAAGIFVDRP